MEVHSRQRPWRGHARLRHALLAFALCATCAAHAQEIPPVERFVIAGNTLLPDAAIEQHLTPFRGARNLQQLRDAAAAVQELYRRAGYGGVVAFLPEQALGEGAATIRVVEGRLRRIDVVDNRHFSRETVLASLPALELDRTPQVRLIDGQIQMANESPARTVQVLLQPGERPGDIAARVTVVERPLQRWTLRADNTGSERTGRWRLAAGWQHGDAFGLDHVFSAELQTSPGHASDVAIASAGYRMPFYAHALALDAYAAWSDVDAGRSSTAAGDLQFAGRGRIAGLRLSRYLPRLGNVDQRLVLGLERRDYLNSCSIAGLPDVACGPAGASVSVAPVSIGYTAQAVGELRLGINAALIHNAAWAGGPDRASDFEAVRQGARRRYTLLRAAGHAGMALPYGQLAARATVQYSGDVLVAGELFGIGGALSVRGYEERELAGDVGMQASLEWSSPNLLGDEDAERSDDGTDLRALLFADAGWVALRRDTPCLPGQTRCRIAALGAGLRFAQRHVQLRLDWGHALAGAATTRRGDNHVHLALILSF